MLCKVDNKLCQRRVVWNSFEMGSVVFHSSLIRTHRNERFVFVDFSLLVKAKSLNLLWIWPFYQFNCSAFIPSRLSMASNYGRNGYYMQSSFKMYTVIDTDVAVRIETSLSQVSFQLWTPEMGKNKSLIMDAQWVSKEIEANNSMTKGF